MINLNDLQQLFPNVFALNMGDAELANFIYDQVHQFIRKTDNYESYKANPYGI